MSIPGRYCTLNGLAEERDLAYGMDFRLPQYRREVFHRFYEFHLKYRAHPGCVYYLMPYLAERHQWSVEQKLWFAFLNGNTQHPVTSWLIFREFPALQALHEDRFTQWVQREARRLPFDTDRRYFRTKLVEAVLHYRRQVASGTQVAYFEELCGAGTPRERFSRLWAQQGRFKYFGRLSMFSYTEYLRLMGLDIDCHELFLYDLKGSQSHRNGLCKVLGRDDLDWHASNPSFPGYSEAVLAWLTEEADSLLREAQARHTGKSYAEQVSYFTLESALCTYKSWHRPNRRYPNVYNDMLVLRLRDVEAKWGERFGDFWEARQACLPAYLRWEDNPADKGVHPDKQNHYLATGEPVMLHREWPCFRNAYNDAVEAQQYELAV